MSSPGQEGQQGPSLEDITRARHQLHERMAGAQVHPMQNSVTHKLQEAEHKADDLKVKMATQTGVKVPPSDPLPLHEGTTGAGTTTPGTTAGTTGDPASTIRASSPMEYPIKPPATAPTAPPTTTAPTTNNPTPTAPTTTSSFPGRIPSGVILCSPGRTRHGADDDAVGEPLMAATIMTSVPASMLPEATPDMDLPTLRGVHGVAHGHAPPALSSQPVHEMDNALMAALAGADGLDGNHVGSGHMGHMGAGSTHTFQPVTAAQHVPEVARSPVSPHVTHVSSHKGHGAAGVMAGLAGQLLAPFVAHAGGTEGRGGGEEEEEAGGRPRVPSARGAQGDSNLGKALESQNLPGLMSKVGESVGGAMQHVVQQAQTVAQAAMDVGKTVGTSTSDAGGRPRAPFNEDLNAPSGREFHPGTVMSEHRRERLEGMLEEPNPAQKRDTLVDKIIYPFVKETEGRDLEVGDLPNRALAKDAATKSKYTHKEVARMDEGPATTKHHLYMGARNEMGKPEGVPDDHIQHQDHNTPDKAPPSPGSTRPAPAYTPTGARIPSDETSETREVEKVGAGVVAGEKSEMGAGKSEKEGEKFFAGVSGDPVTDTVYSLGRAVIDTTKAFFGKGDEAPPPLHHHEHTEDRTPATAAAHRPVLEPASPAADWRHDTTAPRPAIAIQTPGGCGDACVGTTTESVPGVSATSKGPTAFEEAHATTPVTPGGGVISSLVASFESLVNNTLRRSGSAKQPSAGAAPSAGEQVSGNVTSAAIEGKEGHVRGFDAEATAAEEEAMRHERAPHGMMNAAGEHMRDLGGYGRGTAAEPPAGHHVADEPPVIPVVPYTNTEELLRHKQQAAHNE